MSARFWPITAGLVVALPQLPGWSQFKPFDGPITDGSEPKQFATIGFTSDGQSGSFATEQAPDGFRVQENGVVNVELKAGTGDVDIPAMRAKVQTAIDAVDDWVRDDRRLGGLLSAEGYSTFACTLTPILLNGSAYLARFALNYFTVT